jgi:hypothetical protein
MRDRVVDGLADAGAGGRGRGVPRGADGDDRYRRDPGPQRPLNPGRRRRHGAVAGVRSVDDLDRGPGPGKARGIIGLASGRSGACVEDWIALQGKDFRDAARVAAIDPSAPKTSGIRRALPGARIVVDHFHLVVLANQAVTDVRQHVSRDRHGRRGRKADPAWAHRQRLLCASDRLGDRARARLDALFATDDPTGEIAAAWQCKEHLRRLLAAYGPALNRPSRCRQEVSAVPRRRLGTKSPPTTMAGRREGLVQGIRSPGLDSRPFERGCQFTGGSCPSRAVGALDDLDHVPCVLCRGSAAHTGPGLVDHLHDVLEDVRFGNVAVRAGDVRQHAHLCFPVGHWGMGGQFPTWEVDGLAIEQDPL